MKNLISTFLILTFTSIIFSCNIERRPIEKSVPSKLPIEKFVSEFKKNNPNYFNNEVTREQGNKDFKVQLEKCVDSLHLFEGLPIELKRITRDKKGNNIAQFRCVNYNRFEYQDSISGVGFDVWGNISDSLATTLKEDTEYMFYGKCIGFVNYATASLLANNNNLVIWSNNLGLEQDDIFKEQVEVYLGLSFWEFDSIVPFQGRQYETITIK